MTHREQASTTDRTCGTCAHWVHMASDAAPTFVLVELNPDLKAGTIGRVTHRLGDCLVTMCQVWCYEAGCSCWASACEGEG